MMGALLTRFFAVCQAQGAHIALRETDGAQMTYAELAEAVKALALECQKQGLQAGDRLMLVSENSMAGCVGFFAGLLCRAWVVPVNARQPWHEVQTLMHHATPRLALLTAGASPEAAQHAERLGAKQSLSGLHLADVPVRVDGPPEDHHKVRCLIYTSGTTGNPKGVMLSEANLLFGADSAIRRRQLSERDVLYAAAPLTHILGLSVTLLGGLLSGASLLLEARFSVQKALKAIQQGITVFSTVPLMHARMIEHAQSMGIEHLRHSAVRLLSSGGAPLDLALKKRVEAFYGAAMQNGYGMTETTAATSCTEHAIGSEDVSVGTALPEVDLQLDCQVAAGNPEQGIGEVLVRGPQVMLGYYQSPEATRQVFTAKGYLRTGDLGQMDAKGRLHLVGRCKELIIRGGFNVYSQDVEQVLLSHSGVAECAVIGRAVDNADEEIVAFIKTRAQAVLSEDSLRVLCQQKLARYKVPNHIVMANQLPTSASGKILKTDLLRMFADQLPPIHRQ